MYKSNKMVKHPRGVNTFYRHCIYKSPWMNKYHLLNCVYSLPHVDMERLWFVDLKASRPCAVEGVHEAYTQQLVIVIAGPVEDNTGAGWSGDITFWVGRTLGQNSSLMTAATNIFVYNQIF